jgi:antitoxin YefM
MLQGIRQRAVVDHDGKLMIVTPELRAGTQVEVIVLVEPEQDDTTAYLLASEANREHLLRALRELDDPAAYVPVDIETL